MNLRNEGLRNDQGNISILVLIGIMGLLSFLFGAGFLIQTAISAHKLNNTADLAALAAAKTLISQPDQACVIAADIATENKSVLSNCEVNDDEVNIRVSAKPKLPFWLQKWSSIGRSRAGIDYSYE